MYYNDHEPPHFHAKYGGADARVRIDVVGMMDAGLPARAESMVLQWASQYQNELMSNWQWARAHMPLQSIPPLP
jgi:hypothetical protein